MSGTQSPVEQPEVGFKVFVGNLSFKTTNEGLKEFFGAAGNVADAKIIHRGRRSLGYGFVTFENQKDAESCVQLFDKKELDGRTINVENATVRDPNQEKSQTAKPVREASATRGRGAKRAGFKNTGNRSPKTHEPKEDGEPSKTTLFVANIPFKFQDENLLQLFGTFKPVKAHIISRRNGMSKGFGFVEFANEADQQKALSMNAADCEGRELIVKVALGSEAKKEE